MTKIHKAGCDKIGNQQIQKHNTQNSKTFYQCCFLVSKWKQMHFKI